MGKPVLTRQQRLKARLRDVNLWLGRHWMRCLVVAVVLTLGTGWLVEMRRDPLERSLETSLSHVLRGYDHWVTVSRAPATGAVLTRQPSVTVIVGVPSMYCLSPERLDAVRRLMEAQVDVTRGDRVQVVETSLVPGPLVFVLWTGPVLGLPLALLAHRQRWGERGRARLQRWREARKRPGGGGGGSL